MHLMKERTHIARSIDNWVAGGENTHGEPSHKGSRAGSDVGIDIAIDWIGAEIAARGTVVAVVAVVAVVVVVIVVRVGLDIEEVREAAGLMLMKKGAGLALKESYHLRGAGSPFRQNTCSFPAVFVAVLHQAAPQGEFAGEKIDHLQLQRFQCPRT